MFLKGLLVDIHIHMMTHTIPNPLGITFPAVVVLTVNQVVLVIYGFILAHPGPAVGTVNILNVFFFHENPKIKINFLQALRVRDR
jgi:hypothetical protein